MAKVLIKNLGKSFGKTAAVKNLNLEVADGSFVVLLGPSGCGKTTTLRCVAGLEVPDQGEICIGERIVNDLAPKDRDIAMVFQSYALYPHMTVYDNMAFPLKMRKAAKGEIEKRVKETAELLRIGHLLGRKPKQLSGGEAQRTALGRAIVRDPKVFLMDEPLSNLDAKLRVHMRAELKRLQKEIAVTTIYVTHDQVEAMTMADKVAIMNVGELQQFGNAHEIFDHPASIFVAGFIGSPPMNFIDCTHNREDKSGVLDAGSFKIELPQAYRDHAEVKRVVVQEASGSELTMGIRPEDISLSKQKNLNSIFEAEVYVTEPLGSEIIVDIQMDGNILKARTPPDFVVAPRDRVWIAINRDRIHLFDKKSGKAIV